MSAPPLRRRDRGGGGLSRDYYDLDARPDPRDPRAAPYYEPSRSPPPSSRYDEPRRGKSERRAPRPRPRSPDYQEPSRRSSRRADPRPSPQVVNGGGRRPLTPPYAADPPKPRRGEGREPRDGREPRQRSDRYSMPPPSRDRDRPRDRDPYAAGGRGPRDEPDLHAGASRRRRSPPPPSRGRDSHEPRHEPRSRGRDYPPPANDDRYGGGPPPRRARSSARPGESPPHGRPPPANRSRGAPAPGGGGGGGGRAAGMGARVRRNSMPAVNAINRPKINGNPWWQNPTVQAGARNAFTAGAQAAFRNKNDSGPWLGPKGAKVATAALSAAFVDGLIGGQNRGGDR